MVCTDGGLNLSPFCPTAVEITSCLTRICEVDCVYNMTGILCKNAQKCNSLSGSNRPLVASNRPLSDLCSFVF